MYARHQGASLLALALLAAASPAAASNPGTYQVGTVPVSVGVATVQLPVARGFATELGGAVLTVGAYDDKNPFANLWGLAPMAWLHFDGVQNLRLSAGFQEVFYGDVSPGRYPNSHEERGVVRARFQQPRGAAALYEMIQLDVQSFEDPGKTQRLVFRPRLRIGQGFNLDAVRIHSLALYQEVALRYAEQGYAARAFEFFRVFLGYTFTTRRGTFVSLGVVGQITLNPQATAYNFLFGPALGITHWFRAAPAETPPPAPDVEMQ
jgi:hypothetical protein